VAGRVSGDSGGGSGDGEPVVLITEGGVAAEVDKIRLHEGNERLWV
jgi:hypothetical protein